MANVKYILEGIRVEGAIRELLVKSNAENVKVNYNGKDTTLAAALAEIYVSLTDLPNSEDVDSKISAAIDKLIGGAPETYDTLQEIASYIETHQDAADALTAAIGNKVDKVEGKGLSTEDFTTALKNKLESLPESLANATAEADGLMSKEDKAKLDGLRGVRVGAEIPDDLQDGELFVRVVSEDAEDDEDAE